jgi:hypothetical protein
MITPKQFDETSGAIFLSAHIQVLTLRPQANGKYRAICFSFWTNKAFMMDISPERKLEVVA